MKTQKRTSSPKKKEKIASQVIEGVLSQAKPPPKAKPQKEIKPEKEINDSYALKVTVDISEIEELSNKIKELEKALEKAEQQIEFQKWLVKDRIDTEMMLSNTPWYKLLWMRFKGDI